MPNSTTTFTVRGFKIRSHSQRRYIIVVVQPRDIEATIPRWDSATKTYVTEPHTFRAGASIRRRSDSIATARREAQKYHGRGCFGVVIDTITGKEV